MVFKKGALPAATILLLFLSCEKPAEKQTVENFGQHPIWTDSNPETFWDKPSDDGLWKDTAWEDDTTLYF